VNRIRFDGINFKRKERAGKHEDHRVIMAAELRKERATRMEGSFGKEKQQYSLDTIKARTEGQGYYGR